VTRSAAASAARSQLADAVSASSGEHALAAALIELVAASPSAMARLIELLEEYRHPAPEPVAPIYTVASLAAVLNVSPKVIRGAIARGELGAVKRGGRWIISADAVRAWAHRHDVIAPTRLRRPRTTSDPPLSSAIALLPGANDRRRAL
jgi:excisionase family DNA binding protein